MKKMKRTCECIFWEQENEMMKKQTWRMKRRRNKKWRNVLRCITVEVEATSFGCCIVCESCLCYSDKEEKSLNTVMCGNATLEIVWKIARI